MLLHSGIFTLNAFKQETRIPVQFGLFRYSLGTIQIYQEPRKGLGSNEAPSVTTIHVFIVARVTLIHKANSGYKLYNFHTTKAK